MARARAHESGQAFRKARRAGERIHVLGGAMDLVRPEEVLLHTHRAVDAGRRMIVANHNLHSLYLLRRDAALAEFYRSAEIIQVDSTPVIAFAKLLGLRSRRFHRSTYLDWREDFWTLADREGWRVFYLGGGPGVADRAAAALAARYPNATIGTAHGYFDAAPGSAENADVLRRIAAFAPHVLLVGMGMPRQELWIQQNLPDLPASPVFSVGAAFDYEAGVQRAAPRWMGRLGVEWLFRLFCDPRRLFSRYCVEPWL